jgi:hypothetical protein
MRADVLVDLQPPPEVTALGRPDQVFRLTPSMRNLLAYGGQALGVAALSLTVWVMVGASLQGQANAFWVPPALVFVALSCILLVWAGKVHRGPVYAFFPGALALCQDGHWSVLPWEDVRAFRDRSGLALYPSLALRDGGTVVLRSDLFDPTPFYEEVKRYLAGDRQPRPAAAASPATAPPAAGSLTTALADAGAAAAPALAASRKWVGFILGELRCLFTSRQPKVWRDLLIAGGWVALGVLGLAWNGRWILSAIRGPAPITLAELAKLRDPAELKNPWVTFVAERVKETDLERLSRNRRGWTYKEGKYWLVEVQGRWLIAEVPPEHTGRRITGYLDVWSSPFNLRTIDQMRSRVPDGRPLLPFQLDGAYGYRSNCASLVALILLPTLAMASLWLLSAWTRDFAKRRGLKLEGEEGA